MIIPSPMGPIQYLGDWRHTYASDPVTWYQLLLPCRTVIWTWSRMIDKTVPIWEKP